MGYPLCFNNECANKSRCMHHQARLLTPANRYYGSAVLPTAIMDQPFFQPPGRTASASVFMRNGW